MTKTEILAALKNLTAEVAVNDYMPGGVLYDLSSPDSEPYFDSESEYLNAGIKTNA